MCLIKYPFSNFLYVDLFDGFDDLYSILIMYCLVSMRVTEIFRSVLIKARPCVSFCWRILFLNRWIEAHVPSQGCLGRLALVNVSDQI